MKKAARVRLVPFLRLMPGSGGRSCGHRQPVGRWLLLGVLLLSWFSAGTVVHAADTPTQKLRVVVFGGHPDDPETGAGGLITTLTQAGHEVIVGYATSFRGDRRLGGEQEAVVRQREARAACKVMGQPSRFFPLPTKNWKPTRRRSTRSRLGWRKSSRTSS